MKKVTNVFSKKILAKRALREIKLLQHFRGEGILFNYSRGLVLTGDTQGIAMLVFFIFKNRFSLSGAVGLMEGRGREVA